MLVVMCLFVIVLVVMCFFMVDSSCKEVPPDPEMPDLGSESEDAESERSSELEADVTKLFLNVCICLNRSLCFSCLVYHYVLTFLDVLYVLKFLYLFKIPVRMPPVFAPPATLNLMTAAWHSQFCTLPRYTARHTRDLDFSLLLLFVTCCFTAIKSNCDTIYVSAP
jgi:hypothetical protein